MSHLPQRWHNRRIGHGLQLPAWRPRPALPAAPRPARLAALRPPRLVHPRRRRPSRPPALLPGPPRRRVEDIAFRVLAANQTPDHVTIARFRVRHEQALAGFLVQSLKLCAAAGMVRVGVVALDGTKLAGNAADKANRTLDRLEREVAEILRQAADVDRREDRL